MNTLLFAITCCITLDLIYRFALWLSWHFRYFRAGQSLMDASLNQRFGKVFSYTGMVFVVGCVAFGMYLVAFHLSWPDSPHERSHFTYQFVFLAWMLITGLLRGKLELCERGIMNAGSLIPWQEIKSWSWGTRLGNESVLTITQRRALFHRSKLRFSVPANKEDGINGVMQTLVP